MFENYPKERTVLSPEFQKIYSEHYKNNREGSTSASSLAQKMEAWLHRKVAKDVIGIQDKSTLEIGAGTKDAKVTTTPSNIVSVTANNTTSNAQLNAANAQYQAALAQLNALQSATTNTTSTSTAN